MIDRFFFFWAVLILSSAVGANDHWIDPEYGIQFVSVPKGCFDMGRDDHVPPPESSAWDQLAYRGSQAFDEKPKHQVCVDAFWIGVFEVRASEWTRVMGEPPPAGLGNQPASGITWLQAQAFVGRLSKLSGDSLFRLPTEAEWEYACRAGRKTDYFASLYGGDPIGDLAWYNDTPRQERHFSAKPAGQRKANDWGLHDILGNVWEWTQDAYLPNAYKRHRLVNPFVGIGAGSEKVIRGGSYRSQFPHIRCGNRSRFPEDESLDQIGLRLVRQPTSAGGSQ